MTDFKARRRTIAAFAGGGDARAIAIAGTNAAIYASALIAFCTLTGPLRFVGLAIASLTAGTLFVVGHDASHRSLARTPWLNATIAHLAFVPTLHPQAAWARGHNWRHHGYTNLRGMDYVWAPWSPSEYAAASGRRRAAYRFFRTPLGVGFYYAIAIWWPHFWHDDAVDRTYAGAHEVGRDRNVARTGFATLFAACFALGTWHHGWAHGLVTAGVAVAVPFAYALCVMSVVIFMHHTHPSVRWYDSRASYDARIISENDTVHVTLPRAIELYFHDIFQHPAHHLNPRVPLHRLAAAQRALEADRPTGVREAFSFQYLLRVLRDCQLYDYGTHRWLSIATHEREVRDASTWRATKAS